MIPAIEVPETHLEPQAATPAPEKEATVSDQLPLQRPTESKRNEETEVTLSQQQNALALDKMDENNTNKNSITARINVIEKSVIIHRDENGFGLRVKGQSPVFVEHVHENGAAWRAGVREFDLISKVNGSSVSHMHHKDVILMFKSCSRFVGLTLLSSKQSLCLTSANASCFHQQQSSSSLVAAVEGNDNVTAANNQFQLHSSCLAAAMAAWPPAHNEGGGGAEEEEATNVTLLEGHPSACHCKRRLLVASGSGSTRTLLSLNLKQQQQQQQQHQSNHHYQLSGEEDRQSLDCAATDRRRHHKLSPISTSSVSRKGYNNNDLATLLLRSNSSIRSQLGQQQVYEDNCNSNNNNNTCRQLTRRSESVSYNKPCYLSIPQYLSFIASEQNGGGQPKGCICISCRSLLQLAATSELQQNQERNHRRREGDMADADCRQCRIITKSSAGGGGSFNRLSYRNNYDKQTQHSNQLSDQQMGTSIKMDSSKGEHKQNTLTTAAKEYYQRRISQSPSTSSLPIESQRAKTSSNNNNNSSKEQPILRNPLPIQQQQHQTNKRLEIIRELIDTEKTHTDRLRCLDELFYRPLKSGGFMTSEQLRMVFSCHRTLYKIHRQIYRILLSVNYNLYPEPLIGSALIEIFEGDLKRRLERASCNFCASQSTNAELLNKLTRRDTKVGEFLAHVTSQQMVGRLGIKDLLASCFQRLTKYPLLLENLLKATPQAPPKMIVSASYERRRPAKCQRLRPGLKVNSSIEAYDGSQEANSAEEEEEEDEDDDDEEDDGIDDDERERRRKALEDSHRMMTISLAEEREFIERALNQSRQILVRVNDSVKVAMSHNKLKEIWKRTDKYPGVPLIDITKQQVVHEGLLTLRLSKRSFDVYVLLLNDYLIILTREGQDKYRLKFFTPEGKSSSSASANNQSGGVYSPVFVIDEHLTTRDAATDENGFYLLCKRKDDSRIYEFASRSPAERSRWRDKIQWTIERQMGKMTGGNRRRSSCESAITKSSSEISSNRGDAEEQQQQQDTLLGDNKQLPASISEEREPAGLSLKPPVINSKSTKEEDGSTKASGELSKIEGTISLVVDDGIIQPHKMESSQALVNQAIQVNICDRSEKPVTSADTSQDRC